MARHVEVLWVSDALSSSERCVVSDIPGSNAVCGTAVLPWHDAPATVTYEIDTDADWVATAARVWVTAGSNSCQVMIERGHRTWLVDGIERPDLAVCEGIDLGWSPATNTLPLRAKPLAIGASTTLSAAWLRFPELDVVVSEQTYTRVAADQVRYDSATFSAELIMGVQDVVELYGQGLWRAEALRHSPAELS